MPKKLEIRVLMRSNDGTVVLLINGKEYTYSCDNAVALVFVHKLRKRTINKGKLFAWFKRKSTLVSDSNFEQL